MFVKDRIKELSPTKSQREIAMESGFPNANVLSMIKNGDTKLALDRVPALAEALSVDPAFLFRLALQQKGNESIYRAAEEIFGTVVSRNEVHWLRELRDAADNTDPRLGKRERAGLRAIFRK